MRLLFFSNFSSLEIKLDLYFLKDLHFLNLEYTLIILKYFMGISLYFMLNEQHYQYFKFIHFLNYQTKIIIRFQL